MYPAELFGLITPFPRDNRVFVAMSFDPLLERRWTDVIEPGVADAGLQAYRVNASKISDSIITQIERGIATARLVLADISTVGATRNTNVMYEVGLAHAVRQPQEVILFRSDTDRLLFDLSQVRVNMYDPDRDAALARQTVRDAVADAIKEVDLRKSLAVDQAANRVDESSIIVLMTARKPDGFPPPSIKTAAELLGTLQDREALSRLLDAGLVRAAYQSTPPPEKGTVGELITAQLRYKLTSLGQATLDEVVRRLTSGLAENADLLLGLPTEQATAQPERPNPE